MYFQSLCDFLHVTLLFIIFQTSLWLSIPIFYCIFLKFFFLSEPLSYAPAAFCDYMSQTLIPLCISTHGAGWLKPEGKGQELCLCMLWHSWNLEGLGSYIWHCVCLKHFFLKKSFLGSYVEIYIFPTLDAICNIYLNWTSINKTQQSEIETKTWPIQGTKKGQLHDPILHVSQIKKPQKSHSAALSFFKSLSIPITQTTHIFMISKSLIPSSIQGGFIGTMEWQCE